MDAHARPIFRVCIGDSHTPNHIRTQDVTYVSSPVFLSCCSKLDAVNCRLPNNLANAHTLIADAKANTMRVKSMSSMKSNVASFLQLSHVHLYLNEWIPFGRNHVANVCSRLMLESKGHGGLFSSVTDRDTKNATVEHRMDAIGNCMSVIDMVEVRFVFDAVRYHRHHHGKSWLMIDG